MLNAPLVELITFGQTGTFFGTAFLIVLLLVLLLNWIGLPANWLILALIFLASLVTDLPLDATFWILAIGAALTGELLEWLILASQAKKAGASGAGTLAGMVGAFAGAIVGAPFLLGVGALIGALAGAFAGCLITELLRGEPMEQALIAAKGTLVGRFLGSVCKCGAGLAIIVLTARRIFATEALPPLPDLHTFPL